MTLQTPTGPLVLATSPADCSARRYFLFQQAWAKEVGIGSDMYAQDGHLKRLGLFLGKDNEAAKVEYNHTLLGFNNLAGAAPVSHLALALAPLALSLDGQPWADLSEAGLLAASERLLDVLTQQQLAEAVADSKKNFSPA